MKKPLYKIPVPSTSLENGGASLRHDTICYQFYRGSSLISTGIRFVNISALRKRAERCCTPWHIDEAYDTLVEVQPSKWLEEIETDTQAPWSKKWSMHHYLIYLDGAGAFEFIAENFLILPEIARNSSDISSK